MQTIEEYKAYTKQLEGEVSKWHHAYDALIVERNALVNRLLKYEKTVSIRNEESAQGQDPPRHRNGKARGGKVRNPRKTRNELLTKE